MSPTPSVTCVSTLKLASPSSPNHKRVEKPWSSTYILRQLGLNALQIENGFYRTEGGKRPFTVEALAECFAEARGEDFLKSQKLMWKRLGQYFPGQLLSGVWVRDSLHFEVPEGGHTVAQSFKACILGVWRGSVVWPVLWQFVPDSGSGLSGWRLEERHNLSRLSDTQWREVEPPRLHDGPRPRRMVTDFSDLEREWAGCKAPLSGCLIRDICADKVVHRGLVTTAEAREAKLILEDDRRRWLLEETYMNLTRYWQIDDLPAGWQWPRP